MNQQTSDLEIKAAEERRRLETSFEQLKERVRETVDMEAQIRRKVLPISGIAGLTAAVLGYRLAGIFSRR